MPAACRVRLLRCGVQQPVRSSANEMPWTLLLTLTLAIAVAVGAVRMSYGLLLPPMRESLNLSYTQAGLLQTINFVGYLIGSATAAQLTGRFGLGRANAIAIGLTTLMLALTATTLDFWTGAVWRWAAGVTSGWTFVLTSSLVISRAPPHRTAFYTGIVYGGAGLGTVIGSVLISLAFLAGGESAWRWGWLLLALAGAAVTVLAFAISAAREPATRAGGATGLLASLAVLSALRRPAILSVLVAYFLFAAGYIIYGTFYVAYLVDSGVETAVAGQIWSVLGILAIVSGIVWGALAARFGSRSMVIAAFAVEAGAVLLPLFTLHPGAYYVSAAAYGITVFGIPSILMSFSRGAVSPEQIPRAVGIFTVVFSVGQMAGPVVAGFVIDRSGGAIAPALVIGAALLVLAGLVVAPFLRSETRPKPISPLLAEGDR